MSFNPSDYTELMVDESPIPGLFIIKIPVHGDSRGWFKENYQKEKMTSLGLPNFDVVQNNISYNHQRGVTRGLHAEPWDKFISTANGSVFGAWVDLRKGASFGKTFSIKVDPGTAVYVPRGVANGYQTLEANVVYTYLVNEHWSPSAKYTSVHSFDPKIDIAWPIPQKQAIISEKDLQNPLIKDIVPMEF